MTGDSTSDYGDDDDQLFYEIEELQNQGDFFIFFY